MDVEARHRALAGGSRLRILEALRSADRPLDASRLGEALGLHVSTIRSHLVVLERARLVERRVAAEGRPGRPRVGYVARPEEAEAPYRMLAGILAEHVAASVDGRPSEPERAGRAWGRRAATAEPPAVSAEDARARLLSLLGGLGFAPEAADDRIMLHACPFRDVAEAHPEVVCAIHLGLMRGVLEQLRAPVRASDLHPFVEPDLCVADLEEART